MRFALSVLVAFAVAGCVRAQTAASPALAIRAVMAKSSAPMVIRLASPDDQASIAARHSAYGANLSPPLAWTGVAGAESYAVVVEDPDAPGPRPFVHWLIWNIPGALAALPENVPAGPTPALPSGAAQGRNGADTAGYFGPRPPSGTHHYHFQIFAVDRTLDLAAGADRDALVSAMRGHVLASGDRVANFSAPPH